MKYKLSVMICMCMMILTRVGIAATNNCVKSLYTVTYGCNGGTLSGTLPSSQTATYGATFTPTAVTKAMCTPPSGHVYAGQSILIDGKEVAYYTNTSNKSFMYYYTSDIVVAPHWAPIAEKSALAANLGASAHWDLRDPAAMTWTVGFWYGVVSGIARCSTYKPENTASGHYTGLTIPESDNSTIENSTSGQYCYCRMTSPNIAGSPWVFNDDTSSASNCASYCTDTCGFFVGRGDGNGQRFRASVFAAAGN